MFRLIMSPEYAKRISGINDKTHDEYKEASDFIRGKNGSDADVLSENARQIYRAICNEAFKMYSSIKIKKPDKTIRCDKALFSVDYEYGEVVEVIADKSSLINGKPKLLDLISWAESNGYDYRIEKLK